MKKLLFCFLIQVGTFNLISAQWTTAADIPQKIRAGNTESHVENGTGYAYLFGGRNDQEIISNKTFRYNFSANIWETMADLPTPILGASSAKVGTNIYIIGGLVTTPGATTKKVYKYSIPTNLWSQVADTPSPYTDGDAVAYQDSLIYTVGSTNGEKTFVYNVNTNKWRPSNPVPSPGYALTYGAVSTFGNKLIYVGGSNGTFSPTFWNNVWIGEIDQTDRSIINWTAGTPFPGETRTFFEMRPWKNGLILVGGSTDNTFDTVSDETYFYDPQMNSWSLLPSKPTAWNTGNAASIFIDGVWKFFCTGGFNVQYLKNTEIYTQENLSTANSDANECHIRNMKTISGKDPKLSFCTKENGNISLKIFDAKGSLIREREESGKAGRKIISLRDLNISTGIYFVSLFQNGNRQSKKIQIIQ